MKVTIVVAYNTQVDMTLEFLQRIKETITDEVEVYTILVHGYVNERDEYIHNHPFVDKFVRLKNEGFCKTLNAGLKEVPKDSDYIFFVGNDSFPLQKGWLTKLILTHNKTKAAVICPLATKPSESEYQHLYKKSDDNYHYCDFFPTIAWLIPMETFNKIGLLDERLTGPGYFADNDWSRKVVHYFGNNSIVIDRNVTLEHRLSVEGKSLNLTKMMNANREQYELIKRESL